MLINFVLLDGLNMTEPYAYTRKIFAGLIFSVIGDAILGKPLLPGTQAMVINYVLTYEYQICFDTHSLFVSQ